MGLLPRLFAPRLATVDFDAEGDFFARGAHAEIVTRALERAGIRATARDLVQRDLLAIELEHDGLVLRATGKTKAGESDWCDLALVGFALNEAARTFGWPARFAWLETRDQGASLACVPPAELPALRAAGRLELTFFDDFRALLYPAGARVLDDDVFVATGADVVRLSTCEVVSGEVGPVDVLVALEGVAHLVSVGSVSVFDATVRDLSGFRALRFAGAVEVHRCRDLVSLAGLESLERVTGPIAVTENPRLTDATALRRLRQVDDPCSWSDNGCAAPRLPVRTLDPAEVLDTRRFPLAAPTRLDGVLVEAWAKYDLRGRLEAGRLAENARIGRWTARAGTDATFHRGKLSAFTLADPVDRLPAGAHVVLWEDSDLPCEAELPGGEWLAFDEDGRLIPS